MDIKGINALVADIIKQYEQSESHAILFYSSDKTRDYKIMEDRVKKWRVILQLSLIEEDGSEDAGEAGTRAGAKDIQE